MADPRQSIDERARTPPIVLTAYGFAAFFAVALLVQGIISLGNASQKREIGWTWTLTSAGWHVREVLPDGPASGALEVGDRILAVNGDVRIGTIGPAWTIRNAPVQAPYSVDIERNGTEQRVELSQRITVDPSQWILVAIQLLTALAFAVVAVIMVLARPHEEAVRGGFWGSSLISIFYLWQSSNPYDGVLQGWALDLQLLLGSTFPLYLWGGYRFFAAFPDNQPEQGRWKLFLNAILVGAWAIWLPRAIINVVQLPSPAAVAEVVYSLWPILNPYVRLGGYLESVLLTTMVVGSAAAMTRNYRRLEEGDARRRIRWVAGAMMFSAGIVVAATFVELGTTVTDASAAARASATRIKVLANVVAITMPLALAYAIIRHRVMGIELVVRMGLRYVLAKAVLQAVVALPAVWLLWSIVSRPDSTVGELLFQGSGRANLVVLTLGAFLLRYRRPVREALDRRFFREAYDQEQILIGLTESIKELDSIQEISRMVSTQVDAALHVERIVILLRSDREVGFIVGFSSDGSETPAVVPGTSGVLTGLEDVKRPVVWRTVRPRCSVEEREWLDRLALDLLVPILGVDQDLVGVLMLGAKRSEEPYSPRDRSLLLTLMSQVGAIWEVLSLREKVSRDRRVQSEVLDKLREQEVNLLKECPACGLCYDQDEARCPNDDVELELSLPVERTVEDRYHLERSLGRGGMGAVFQATDLRLGRRVAIKVMVGSLFGDASAQRRFAREAQASARLVHPNIVRVYDFGELRGGGAYLVMEMVDGATLRDRFQERKGPFPTSVGAEVIRQLMAGMHAAHDAGVLHRDLKPDNLMLDEAGAKAQVKILDFGLAKIREMEWGDPKSRTATGIVMGTLGYMSPEQFLGDSVDQRADVYSISVISLEVLTGPLRKKGYAVHELIRHQLDHRLRGDGAAKDSEALADALSWGLEWNREDRCPTVSVLRDALLPAVEAWPGPASPDAELQA